MSYYVISDTNFNNKIISKKLELSLENYNQMLIDNWNSVVSSNDTVFIFGVFGAGYGDDLQSIIEKLNGTIYLTNFSENQGFDRKRWQKMGIYAIWDCSFTYPIDDDLIFFSASEKCHNDICKYRILTKKDGAAEVYKDNKLSIEAKYWNYKPILLKNIPLIIKEREEIK
jgi:calcineurin-like phosphoesterase family protein